MAPHCQRIHFDSIVDSLLRQMESQPQKPQWNFQQEESENKHVRFAGESVTWHYEKEVYESEDSELMDTEFDYARERRLEDFSNRMLQRFQTNITDDASSANTLDVKVIEEEKNENEEKWFDEQSNEFVSGTDIWIPRKRKKTTCKKMNLEQKV